MYVNPSFVFFILPLQYPYVTPYKHPAVNS
jgi:hypothetical protein